MGFRSPSLISQFFADADRIQKDAGEILSSIRASIESRAPVSGEDCLEFFRQIHTLKGICTLMDGAERAAGFLHGLEARLACADQEQSAASAKDWIEEAEHALAAVQEELEAMKKATRPLARRGRKAQEPLGVLIHAAGKGTGRKVFWVPLRRVQRVLTAEEVALRDWIPHSKGWVPLINPADDAIAAVVLLGKHGYVAIAVQEVLRLCTRGEAETAGAMAS